MIGMRIDSSALRKKFAKGEREFQRDVTQVLRTVTETARDIAAKKFKSRTGKLVKSIRARRRTQDEYTLEATAPHARFVEYGTRPHVITPRNGTFLRFVVGGRVVYARKVNHPGTKPTHFLRESAMEVLPLFERLILGAAKSAFTQ